jgi:hypothetical protein
MIEKMIESMKARILSTTVEKVDSDPFAVFGRGDRRERRTRHPLSGSLIWIVGCAGSGKSEASHAFQKKAADAGMRWITFANHGGFAHRWEDVAHLDLMPNDDVSDHEDRRIASAVRQGAAHTFITVPILMETAASDFDRILVEIEAWIDGGDHERLVVTIRESDFLLTLRPDLVRPLADKIARTGGRLLVEAYDYDERISALVRDGDEILLGRSFSVPLEAMSAVAVEDLQRLREGEFLLKRGGGWIPVEAPYVRPF